MADCEHSGKNIAELHQDSKLSYLAFDDDSTVHMLMQVIYQPLPEKPGGFSLPHNLWTSPGSIHLHRPLDVRKCAVRLCFL